LLNLFRCTARTGGRWPKSSFFEACWVLLHLEQSLNKNNFFASPDQVTRDAELESDRRGFLFQGANPNPTSLKFTTTTPAL
jgi:hypothetical protein